MSRRFIKQLGERESINEVYLLGDKQLRQNRNGNLYLQMRLSDKTGAVTGMMWNATNDSAQHIDNGDYVQIEGATQVYNGNLQIIVNRISRAEPDNVSDADFVSVSRDEIQQLSAQLAELLGAIQDPPLRQLADRFLNDATFMDKFQRAPAAIKNHHAYHGGLLAHVVNLMRVSRAVAEFYPAVDADLLVMGAFLHDVGKVDELSYARDLAYSDEGQLIGHLVQGVGILQSKIDEWEQESGQPFPAETALRLKHMIVSHHGKYEFGSPKIPMTPEAIALHFLDDLDAKLHWFQQVVDEDPNVDSGWTPFQPNLGRKLFKGTAGNRPDVASPGT